MAAAATSSPLSLPSPLSVSELSDVKAKSSVGLTNCMSLLSAENNFVEAYKSLAKSLRTVHMMTLNLSLSMEYQSSSQASEEENGFLEAWGGLLNYFREAAKWTDQFVYSLTTAVTSPLSSTIHLLQNEAEKSKNSKGGREGGTEPIWKQKGNEREGGETKNNYAKSSSSSAFSSSSSKISGGEKNPELQKAERKLALAEDELQKATAARSELMKRFGSQVNANLLKKSEDRIERAKKLHENAEGEVTKIMRKCENKNSATSTIHAPKTQNIIFSSSARSSYSPDTPNTAESVEFDSKRAESNERRRLESMKESMKTMARAMADYQQKMNRTVVDFSKRIECFDPYMDMQSWLSRVLKVPLDNRAVQQQKVVGSAYHVLRPEDEVALVGRGEPSPSSANVATMRNSLHEKEASLRRSQKTIEELRGRVEELEENARKTTATTTTMSRGLGGEQGELRGKATASVTQNVQDAEAAKDDEDEGNGFVKLAAITQFPLDDKYSLSAKIKVMDDKKEKDAMIVKEKQKEAERREYHSPPRPQPRQREKRNWPEWMPDMGACMMLNAKDAAAPVERRWLEVQRRYENYLLGLRNVDVSFKESKDVLSSSSSWDQSSFYEGAGKEEMHEALPIKSPTATNRFTSPLNVKFPYAFEWGDARLDDFQWSCLAYETFLLCYYQHSQYDESYVWLSESSLESEWREMDKYEEARVSVMMAKLRRGLRNAIESNMEMKDRTSELLKQLLIITRVKLGIPLRVSSLISTLMLPLPTTQTYGHWGNIHPLDIRFRAVRLLESWSIVDLTSSNGRSTLQSDSLFCEWVYRQLHILHTSVIFRLHRVIRFIPKYDPSWCSLSSVEGLMSEIRFDDDDEELGYQPNELLNSIREALEIIAGLRNLLERGMWGMEEWDELNTATTTRHRSRGATTAKEKERGDAEEKSPTDRLRRLIFLMGIMECIDTTIRATLAAKEMKGKSELKEKEKRLDVVDVFEAAMMEGKGDARRRRMGEGERLTAASREGGEGEVERENEEDEGEDDGDYYDADDRGDDDILPGGSRRVLHKKWKKPNSTKAITSKYWTSSLSSNCFSVELKLSNYWSYDIPILQWMLAYLFQACTDSSTSDKMNIEAPLLAQGLLLFCRMAQGGRDPTVMGRQMDGTGIAEMSAETIRLLAVQAIWHEAMKPQEDFDNEEEMMTTGEMRRSSTSVVSSFTKSKPPVCVLSFDTANCLYQIISDFPSWLAKTADPEDSDDFHLQSITTSNKKLSTNIEVIRVNRLLRELPRCLRLSFAFPRILLLEAKVTRDFWRNNDWGALEFVNARGEMKGAQMMRKQQNATERVIEGIEEVDLSMKLRKAPEGLSLSLASRVEREIMELLMRRVISVTFRDQIVEVLADYRLRLEPQSLPIILSLWKSIRKMMVWNEDEVNGEAPRPQVSLLVNSSDSYGLPKVLRGPSHVEDMYRYFICTSLGKLFRRLFSQALEAIRGCPTYVNKLEMWKRTTEEEPPADLQMNADKEQLECVGKFGDAFAQFIDEVRCELEFYPKSWAKFLPDNQHSAVVVYTCRLGLFNALKELISSPYWPDSDVPAGGSGVLKAIRLFERLVREVRLSTNLNFSIRPDLLELFAPPVTACLVTRFRSVEDILERCIESETWEPMRPPEVLHSAVSVDMFTFIYHIFEAVLELHAPIDWMLPVFLQFLTRLTCGYCDRMKRDCKHSAIINLRDRSAQIFSSLLEPNSLKLCASTLSVTVEKKKEKGGGGGWSRLKPRGSKKRRKSKSSQGMNANGSAIGGGALTVSGGVVSDGKFLTVPSPRIDGLESDAGSQYSAGTGTDVSDVEESKTAINLKKSKKPRGIMKRFFNTKGMRGEGQNLEKGITRRFGAEFISLLEQVNESIGSLPLPCWLVRLHNLSFFVEQLPSLADRFKQVALKETHERDPSFGKITKALAEAVGAEVVYGKEGEEAAAMETSSDVFHAPPSLMMQMNAFESNATRNGGKKLGMEAKVTETVGGSENRQYGSTVMTLTKTEDFRKLEAVLEDAIDKCCEQVNRTSVEICRFIALRIVYFELQGDLFNDLYYPDFSSSTIEPIVNCFPSTPKNYQDEMASSFLRTFVQGWCLLLTQIGFEGHVYTAEELEVLDNDLDVIREYMEENGIDDAVNIYEDDPEKNRNVLIADHVNDFFVFLANHPSALAQAAQKGPSAFPEEPEALQPPVVPPGPKPPLKERLAVPTDRVPHESDETTYVGPEKKKKKKKGRPTWKGVSKWLQGSKGSKHSSSTRTSSPPSTSSAADNEASAFPPQLSSPRGTNSRRSSMTSEDEDSEDASSQSSHFGKSVRFR